MWTSLCICKFGIEWTGYNCRQEIVFVNLYTHIHINSVYMMYQKCFALRAENGMDENGWVTSSISTAGLATGTFYCHAIAIGLFVVRMPKRDLANYCLDSLCLYKRDTNQDNKGRLDSHLSIYSALSSAEQMPAVLCITLGLN